MGVEERVARLERMNRIWAVTALGSLGALGVLGLSSSPAEELQLNRIVIGDREGLPRMVIEQTDDRVMLSIEHPDDEKVPLLHLGSGKDGAWIDVGESNWVARSDRSLHRFALGHWGLHEGKLTWGNTSAPALELGVRDAGGYACFADMTGLERVAIDVFEPWDNPDTTAGSIIVNSHTGTSRFVARDENAKP